MAKWRRGLAALTLAVLGLATPALAQTYAPTFDLVVSGTVVQVTHDQTFDYGAHPPGASIVAQLHNGPNPECVFTATRSDTGGSQYQNIGGSNGYDTTGHYTDPPPVVLQLPIPIVWSLTLACGQSGTLKSTVSTELPPPPPPPPPPPSPTQAPGPTHATQPPTPASPPKATPSAKPTPSVLGRTTSRPPSQGSPAASPSIPVSTPIVVTETPTTPAPVAAASPSPAASPSRSPSGSPLGAPRGPRGHGPDFLRFFLIAIGALVALIVILYAAGLRWVRVDEEPEDG
jgi:hypothetical protein